jgi:hypothetical protein
VVHYLKKHKKVQEDSRWGHQDYFSKYLVARCWPKMHQRINSWSSKGYIYVLSRIQETELQRMVSEGAGKISAMFADRNNDELAAMVAEMVQTGEMKKVIMLPSGHSEWDFTPLITSFGRMKQDAPQHEDSGTYDVTTCFTFHQLLIATLRAFWIALCALKKAVDAKKRMKDLVQKSNRVWVCGTLLSKIASSRMLRQHLMACLTFLQTPIYAYREAYRKFTNSTLGDGDSSADTDNADPAVEDVDLEGSEDLNEVFLKWVRLQASYWLDLSTLSRTFGSSDPAYPVPEIFLVAVQHPMHNINPFSVEPLDTTLEDVIGYDPDDRINIDDVLAMIMEKGGREHEYPGTIHCEVALAVLIVLAHNLSPADAIRFGPIAELLLVTFTFVIIMLINLTGCAEHGRNYYCSVKAMLPRLLGVLGHLERQEQPIQRPWPPPHPFPVWIAGISFSAGIGRNDHSLQSDCIRWNFRHDDVYRERSRSLPTEHF